MHVIVAGGIQKDVTVENSFLIAFFVFADFYLIYNINSYLVTKI